MAVLGVGRGSEKSLSLEGKMRPGQDRERYCKRVGWGVAVLAGNVSGSGGFWHLVVGH